MKTIITYPQESQKSNQTPTSSQSKSPPPKPTPYEQVLKEQRAQLVEIQQEINQTIEHLCNLKEKLTPMLWCNERWLDSQDVLQLLHISPRKLVGLRTTGKIHYTRIGSKIFYKETDIFKMLYENYK